MKADASAAPHCGQFWTEAEHFFDAWVTRKIREKVSGLNTDHFQSFVPKLTEPGDWTAEVSLNVYSDGLTVEGRVGNALHELCVAREMAATQMLMKPFMGR
jgi:hypothetical protein